MQPQVAGADARLRGVDVLGIVIHALGEHRLNRDLATPSSLLLQAPDGPIKRQQRFALLVESRGTLAPVAVVVREVRAHIESGCRPKRLRRTRSSNARRHRVEVTVAARTHLAEACSSAGNEGMWPNFRP